MKIDVLGVKIDNTTTHEVVSKVKEFIDNNHKFYITTPNPEIVLEANRNYKVKTVLNSADISIPDGIGLKLADTSLNIIKGRDLFVELLKLAETNKWSIFLLGGATEINKKAIRVVNNNYPNVTVNGYSKLQINVTGDPVNAANIKLEDKVVKLINTARPQLLFVAFGAPKQELWCARLFPKLSMGGAMVVGGSLDYLVGKKVPTLVSAFGFEWFWRLIGEPSRIGRILNAILVFPAVFILDKLLHPKRT